MADLNIEGLPLETKETEVAASLPDYLASPNAVFSDEGVEWRYGRPPDYSKTRKAWAERKQTNHAAGSLAQLVENLVKNWEVEASFKPQLRDWRTIDHDNYTFAMNGGSPQTAEHMLKVGTYNAIITPNEYYSPKNSDFASSHKTFKRMMPTFAWEVIEVYSGPPKVSFKWRHWGVMKNDYVGFNNKDERVTAKAHGGLIEIFGITTANVNDEVRLQSVETYMDPLSIFWQIAPDGAFDKEPMNRKIHNAEALDTGPEDVGTEPLREHQVTCSQDAQPEVSEDVPMTSQSASLPQPVEVSPGCPVIAGSPLSADVTVECADSMNGEATARETHYLSADHPTGTSQVQGNEDTVAALNLTDPGVHPVIAIANTTSLQNNETYIDSPEYLSQQQVTADETEKRQSLAGDKQKRDNTTSETTPELVCPGLIPVDTVVVAFDGMHSNPQEFLLETHVPRSFGESVRPDSGEIVVAAEGLDEIPVSHPEMRRIQREECLA